MVQAKICGIATPETLAVAAKAGAAAVGFVFYRRSPRYVTQDQAAALARATPEGVERVGLLVDPGDDELAGLLAAVPLTLLQLHGHEDPARVVAIRQRFATPVMKVVAIAEAADLEQARAYEPVADWLLFDAKPPAAMTNALPGGNAIAFDWRLIAAAPRFRRPWMLSGGLTPQTVGEAVAISGARYVDVSSGVESAPGVKDPERIRSFLEACRTA
ncbi:MAG: phosphoribosylanthranilate isomerase [Alphaproteobacteria bacterium]